jgi:hypothetical protein
LYRFTVVPFRSVAALRDADTMLHHSNLVYAGLMLAMAGCSGGPAVPKAPKLDAAAAAAQAMTLYDSDGDGFIAAAELAKSPALESALAQVDANRDQKLSADEIAGRIRSWSARGTAIKEFKCRVLMNGRPLTGAEVVFQPDPFLGDEFRSGRGQTDGQGVASISMPSDQLPDPSLTGMWLGFYTVRITAANGKPAIPARFNTSSELGQEVADDPSVLEPRDVEFRLTTS